MNIKKPGMAWVGRIEEITPIENADNIVRAEVVCGKGDRWSGVVEKSAETGQEVVVFLPDSIVPQLPELAFMEKRHWRVSPMRLRGCPSEVLIINKSQLLPPVEFAIGTDVTELLDVWKYEKEIPAQLAGEIAGKFPFFIPKTDEPNFQIVPELVQALVGKPCYIATKYDGSSQTVFHKDGYIGACSRNWELREKDGTAVWDIINGYGLKERLPEFGNIAVQWECVGPGIQGNPLQLSQIEPRVFDVWNIGTQCYMDREEALAVVNLMYLPFVEHELAVFSYESDDSLRELAEGVYTESGRQREGIVIRPTKGMSASGERLSFKVLNLLYKERP